MQFRIRVLTIKTDLGELCRMALRPLLYLSLALLKRMDPWSDAEHSLALSIQLNLAKPLVLLEPGPLPKKDDERWMQKDERKLEPVGLIDIEVCGQLHPQVNMQCTLIKSHIGDHEYARA